MITEDEANLALRKAVTDAAVAAGVMYEGQTLGDFVVCAHVIALPDAPSQKGGYIRLFGQPNMETHIAVGLINVVGDLLMADFDEGFDDGEV